MPPPTARRARRKLPVAVLAAVLGAVTLGAPSPASASNTADEGAISSGAASPMSRARPPRPG